MTEAQHTAETPGAHTAPGAPAVPTTDPAALWAEAQVTALAPGSTPAPEYGTPEWLALPPADPRRAAALITAAEQWRRHTAEQHRLGQLADTDPDAWFAEVTADADTEAARRARRIADGLDQAHRAAAHKPTPRPVRATPGWPPVAIPGRPGWFRHCTRDGRQLDLPHSTTGAAAA
ncbi:hypothetical protein [Streptomyces atacamensis]|uniref:hypothetical protein n=1 Tax=Streptomyces atacamensis TaxID=531966 RepID=UPI00399CAA67